ncbi:hypothetical protein GQ602_006238 [Ophiocordyceps camponoti-floridani]|uniref:Uncharacterized protein n=1 Tax=Ophiocordyceps camponoti-floridani TaxID=2030778 RepID=A0A8H4Q2X6_9HYPO|nr:hypothetical protein GQ602_006238 [Ophiocordyceps camponoti-floridani]
MTDAVRDDEVDEMPDSAVDEDEEAIDVAKADEEAEVRPDTATVNDVGEMLGAASVDEVRELPNVVTDDVEEFRWTADAEIVEDVNEVEGITDSVTDEEEDSVVEMATTVDVDSCAGATVCSAGTG